MTEKSPGWSQNVRDKQREETRRRLYNAALEVFRRDGVRDCRIDDIAQLAEVSRAAFYFHFPTKEDVLLELMRESEEPVAKVLRELPPTATLPETLEAMTSTMAGFWKDDPRLILDLATAALRHTADVNQDREAQPARWEMTQRFITLSERGELSDALPPSAMADFFLASALAGLMAWSAAPGLPLKVVLDGVVMLFLDGARGKPKEPAAPTKPAKK